MPGGNKNINGNDGNTFSSTNQPKKYRGVSLVTKLKQRLDKDPNIADDLITAIIDKAKKGDTKAFDIIIDRIDGKVVQPTQEVALPKPQRKNFVDF